MSIELQPITIDNFGTALKLAVKEGQRRFVAENVRSIAEAYVCSKTEGFIRLPMAIYHGDTMVGFIMLGQNPGEEDRGEWWISRLMVDQAHQGKGCGRAATIAAIRWLRAKHRCKTILIGFQPENTVARGLYSSLGFEDTGQMGEGDVVFRLSVLTSDNAAQ